MYSGRPSFGDEELSGGGSGEEELSGVGSGVGSGVLSRLRFGWRRGMAATRRWKVYDDGYLGVDGG